jgi:hypothetical protein
LGRACRVRVDGSTNAQWLLDRLGQSSVFKSSEPLRQDVSSSCCTFQVMYSSQVPRRSFEKLLAGMPEVSLMVDPA